MTEADDKLAADLAKNPLLGRIVSMVLVMAAMKVANRYGMAMDNDAMILVAGASVGVLNVIAWPIAHAINSVWTRFIVPLYWKAFPK